MLIVSFGSFAIIYVLLQFAEYVFRLYDADNSGYLNFREFIAGVSMTSWKNPKTRIEWIFRLYDLDSDGCISSTEMRSVLTVMRETEVYLIVNTPFRLTCKIFAVNFQDDAQSIEKSASEATIRD